MKDKRYGALPETGLVRKATLLQILGVSNTTLWRWVRAGQFPKADYQFGARLPIWHVEDIRGWLAKHRAEREVDNVGRWFEAGVHDASLDIWFGLDAVRQWAAAFGWSNAVYWQADEAVIYSDFTMSGKRCSPMIRFDALRPNEVVFVSENGEESICPDPIALLVQLGGVAKRCGAGRIPEPAKLAPIIASWLQYGAASPRLLAQLKAETEAETKSARGPLCQ